MKTTLLSLFSCMVLFSSAIFSGNNSAEKHTPFKVYIEQNGAKIPVLANAVTLSKKPFNIIFVLPEPTGILVSSSYNKATYEKALKKENLSRLPGYEGTGMAESYFNADNEVIICDDSPSYWYYDNDKENRFNKIVKSKDSIVCTRVINQVYVLDNKETFPIEKITKPLYFVFVDYISDPKTYKRTEFQREMIQINWK